MDLPLFNFSFNLNEEWRSHYKTKFNFFVETIKLNPDEILNLFFLIENWISMMFYNTLHNEVVTHTYDEYNMTLKFPRYNIQCHLTLYI